MFHDSDYYKSLIIINRIGDGMKYYLVYVLDQKGELTKINGITRDKDKAKSLCFETNCAISEIKDLDENLIDNSQ